MPKHFSCEVGRYPGLVSVKKCGAEERVQSSDVMECVTEENLLTEFLVARCRLICDSRNHGE